MGLDKIKSRKLKNLGSEKLKEAENRDTIIDEKVSGSSSKLERNDSLQKKKLKGKRLNVSGVDLEEKKLDKEIEREDNLSITVMVFILIACFVVGGILGYMLYRIALNSSNTLLIVRSFFDNILQISVK